MPGWLEGRAGALAQEVEELGRGVQFAGEAADAARRGTIPPDAQERNGEVFVFDAAVQNIQPVVGQLGDGVGDDGANLDEDVDIDLAVRRDARQPVHHRLPIGFATVERADAVGGDVGVNGHGGGEIGGLEGTNDVAAGPLDVAAGELAFEARGLDRAPAAAGVDLGGPGGKQGQRLAVGLHALNGGLEQPAGVAPTAMGGVDGDIGNAAEADARLAVAHGAVGDPEVPDDGAAVFDDQALGNVPGGVGALVPLEVVAGRVVEGAVGNVQRFVASVQGQGADSGVHRQKVGVVRARKSGPTRWRPGR